MEQANDVARFRVQATEIRPLVQVAPVAGQGQIRRVINLLRCMLLRQDVFDVKRRL